MRRAAVLALAAVAASAFPAVAATPRAGLWDVVAVVVQNGRSQTFRQQHCLTPEMVADPEAAFGEAPVPLVDCARISSWDGTTFRFSLQCEGLGGNGTAQFPTPERGGGRVVMKGRFLGKPLDFSMTLTGTWAAPQCPAGQ